MFCLLLNHELRQQTDVTILDLKGHLLIAMPGMSDPRFARTVVLVCSHTADGSMGFVINQPVRKPQFTEILKEVGLTEQAERLTETERHVQVLKGGPVEKGRGFVLHSFDFGAKSTVRVGDVACLTATLQALKQVASDTPPENTLMLLGYSGWSAGQLEQEIAENGWLTVPATAELVFETATDRLYDAALARLGVSEATLSMKPGHA